MLEFKDLSVQLGRAQILDNVSARFAPGEVTALIGPNGTGKSTLQKALAALIPSGGKVWIDGQIQSRAERRDAIAYMPQDTGAAVALSAFEVTLMGRLHALGLRVPSELRAEAMRMLSRFGLETLAHRQIGSLSGGQRQMAFLAQVLFRAPRVLLLDEPTAALDLRHQLLVLEHVRNDAIARGTVAIVAMHDLSLAARFADRILCLHNGQVAEAGSPQEVLTPQTLANVYGVEAEVTHLSSGGLTIAPLRATTTYRQRHSYQADKK